MTALLRLLAGLVLFVAPLAARDVEARLASPLSTRIRLPLAVPLGAARFSAVIDVPDSAPSDLRLALFCHDRAGRWRQVQLTTPLLPGEQAVQLDLPASDAVPPPGEPAFAPGEVGLLFWSAGASRGRVMVREARLEGGEPLVAPPRLLDLRRDGDALPTGEPWSLSVRPWPAPIDAFDRDAFALSANVHGGDDAPRVVRGRAHGRRWGVTLRPATAGMWTVDLTARWRSVALTAPGLARVVASGPEPTPPANARRVRLLAPLATDLVVPTTAGPQARMVRAEVVVGDDAPADLAVIGWLRDGDGSWRQAEAVQLEPGRCRLALVIPARAWAARAEQPSVAGLRFVSAGSGLELVVGAVSVADAPTQPPGTPRLLDTIGLAVDGNRAALGSTWTLSARPVGGEATLVTTVVDPERRTYSVPWTAAREGVCTLALHPVRAGIHALRLSGRWPDGRTVALALPMLRGEGAPLAPGARDLRLATPLVTRVECAAPSGVGGVQAVVVVGDDAPGDLGVAAWVSDRHGRWYQTPSTRLRPGRHQLRFAFGRNAAVAGIGHGARWSPAEAAKAVKAGLVFSSASATPATLQVEGPTASPAAGWPSGPLRLADLALDGYADGVCRGRTGERWSLTLRALPLPANPFAPEEASIDLVVTPPDGKEARIPAFFSQDLARSDRGDHELVTPSAPAAFAARFRPRQPGRHALRLEARLPGGAISAPLPPLEVAGAAWDGYVRVDRRDKRFFAVDGRPFWALGPNLRSVWDVRARETLGTVLTPDRGTLAYDAYLDRCAVAGVNAVEIWLSSWNLALEWRGDWPGFHGIGRFNEDNAWRLDRVLDRAWARGIRVNLVVNNHGQASNRTDKEWDNNPWNQALGGPLALPEELFTDRRALAGQQRLRRYLVGRYADHPALLGWKLWSEQDLTNGQRAGLLPAWHAQATAAWRALDSYAHPITSHWSGNFRRADPRVTQVLDYTCIDAYHGYDDDRPFRLVHDLLIASTLDPERGLAAQGRPVLVTEFGGNWNAAPSADLLAVDHGVGPWAALVSGHAGAPMLWWFEWLDQGERWSPYRAISRYLTGEDLRGSDARAVTLGAPTPLMARAWARPGRILGYVLDQAWARVGGAGHPVSGARITIGQAIAAGTLRLEWWDADRGVVVASDAVPHGGGRLELVAPLFSRHLAFKLLRRP